MPLQRRLPKRGFTNLFRKQWAVVNLRDLAGFEPGSTVDEPALLRAGLLRGAWDGVKLLGKGEAPPALTVRLDKVSRGARAKIEAAGGRVEEAT